ncbi:MAG: SAM-dependent DNA methyltransferase [Symploca sp. SIO2B6]|nr:SAM-dependent DNA methyltransferase [Symploca sp. SIO2B6]
MKVEGGSLLGVLQSYNLPEKSNFHGYSGLEALTGKSNFDISEWMLIQHLEWLRNRIGTIAMLCKTAVARKVLIHAWKYNYSITNTQIYRIDTLKHFNAAVDGCLFVIEIGHSEQSKSCDVYESLSSKNPSHTIGYHNSVAVADVGTYREWQHLYGTDKAYIWRSGVKHDCSKVMELERKGRNYSNGNGIIVSLENTYIYPLLKSSDVGNERVSECRKYILLTQHYIGEHTAHIEKDAPKTWRYLQDNARAFRKRSSSIYENRPPFSIFGVGDYTFAPWKVAISGFYKKLKFIPVGSIEGRPTICDDTIYFIACWSELEAQFISEILNSKPAIRFLGSMVFWSNKRPITIDLLKRLNIRILARDLGREDEYLSYIEKKS